MTNNPQNLQQFNLLNESIYEDNLLGNLTNWRKLGNKHEQVKQTVLSGYYKLMLFALKSAVKSQADKQLVIR